MRMSFKAILAVSVIGFCILSTARAQDASQQVPPKIIRKSGGGLQRTATHQVTPVYPRLAWTNRVSGLAVVEVTVDEEGNVIAARAVSGHPLLADSAVRAARKWKFRPTTLEGQPVKVIGTISFNFEPDTREIDELKKKIADKPGSAELHYKLGEAYRYNKMDEEAIEEYNQAIQLKSDYAEAYQGLARVYRHQASYDQALEMIKRAISIKPDSNDANPHTLLGSIHLKKGNLEEAMEAYKLAIKMDEEKNDAHYGLALVYIKQGDKESAQNEYNILKKNDGFLNKSLLLELKKLIDQM